MLRFVDTLSQEIHALDRLVKRAARGNVVATQLQSLPGVGPFGALMLEAEIGPITRFRSSHELAAYAGLSCRARTAPAAARPRRRRPRRQPLAQVDPDRDRADAQARPRPRRDLLSTPRPREGESQSDRRRGAKLCCYLYWMLKEGWSYAEWLLQHEPPPSNHASVSSDVEAREDDFGRSWKRRRATLRIAPR